MARHLRDAETDRPVRTLADRKGIVPTEAVEPAVRDALQTIDKTPSLWERLQPLQDRVAAWPSTGLEADKAFYDGLNDEA